MILIFSDGPRLFKIDGRAGKSFLNKSNIFVQVCICWTRFVFEIFGIF